VSLIVPLGLLGVSALLLIVGAQMGGALEGLAAVFYIVRKEKKRKEKKMK
jgi:hypothetical protein